MSDAGRFVYRLVSTVVFILVILIVVLFGYGSPFYRPVVVVSGSMLPTIQINALCMVRFNDFEDVQEGDIIMFYCPPLGENITHRVVEVSEYGLITKGDNNEDVDSMLTTKELYRGKVIGIWNGASVFMTGFVKDGRFEIPKAVAIIYILLTLISGVYLILRWMVLTTWALIIVKTRHALTPKFQARFQEAVSKTELVERCVNNMNCPEGDKPLSVWTRAQIYLTATLYVRMMREIAHEYEQREKRL